MTFHPPFRQGKHNSRAIVDINGLHVATAQSDDMAMRIVEALNIVAAQEANEADKSVAFTDHSGAKYRKQKDGSFKLIKE